MHLMYLGVLYNFPSLMNKAKRFRLQIFLGVSHHLHLYNSLFNQLQVEIFWYICKKNK